MYVSGLTEYVEVFFQVNSALHPSGVAKSSTSFGWGKGGKVTSAGWQVTLCDLIWHVISRSGVVISTTNCYIRFTLLYFTLLSLWMASHSFHIIHAQASSLREPVPRPPKLSPTHQSTGCRHSEMVANQSVFRPGGNQAAVQLSIHSSL